MDVILNAFPLFLVIAIMYFLLIRPQKRRVEEHRKLTESIEPGDRIVTIGGLHGMVRAIGDEEIELEVAPNVTLHYAKSAIARRTTESVPSSSSRSIAPRAGTGDGDSKTEALSAAAVPAAARKTSTRKGTAKRTTPKKTTAKKTAARKTAAKKSTAKKTTARKSTAKKSTARRSSGSTRRN